jgi:hypothetical protein
VTTNVDSPGPVGPGHKTKFVILLDVSVTKRKSFCFVSDWTPRIHFSSLLLEDCLKWVRQQEESEVELQTTENSWYLIFKGPLTEEEKELWQEQPPH